MASLIETSIEKLERRETLKRVGYTSLFVPDSNFDPYVMMIKLRIGLRLYMSRQLGDALMQFMVLHDIPRYDFNFSFTSRNDFVKVVIKDA